jgi:PHD/YefM family antitoxin component YafN of YafNO toxin-antitoxin module
MRIIPFRQVYPPVAVAKHGRPVVVVMAVEEFERLKALDAPATIPAAKRRAST